MYMDQDTSYILYEHFITWQLCSRKTLHRYFDKNSELGTGHSVLLKIYLLDQIRNMLKTFHQVHTDLEKGLAAPIIIL